MSKIVPNIDSTSARLKYMVKFENITGFPNEMGYEAPFYYGGKLPGIAGGSSPTGCRPTRCGADEGFSMRLMFREVKYHLFLYITSPKYERCKIFIIFSQFPTKTL